MADVVTVRRATLDDAAALHANCKSAATLEQVERHLEWTSRERGPHRLEHFVAIDGDGAVVGNVMLMPRGGHAIERDDGALTLCRGRNGQTLHIACLGDWVVTTPLQGQGIGALLARTVMDEARAWGVARLESSSGNPKAVRVLEKLGFVAWGRFPITRDHHETFLVVDL